LRERGVTHLVVGGVTTEVCVQTTMREANDRGFECLLAEDATASYFPKSGYALHTFGPRGSGFSCLASRRMMRRYGAGSTAAAC